MENSCRIVINGEPIAQNAKLAVRFMDRLMGLMGSKELPDCDALIIRPCNSIHTFFMNYPIDVIFVAANGCVIKVIEDLQPWRLTWSYWKARDVVELPAGTLKGKIKEEMYLEYQCTN